MTRSYDEWKTTAPDCFEPDAPGFILYIHKHNGTDDARDFDTLDEARDFCADKYPGCEIEECDVDGDGNPVYVVQHGADMEEVASIGLALR